MILSLIIVLLIGGTIKVKSRLQKEMNAHNAQADRRGVIKDFAVSTLYLYMKRIMITIYDYNTNNNNNNDDNYDYNDNRANVTSKNM